jgi:hypothetical protein
VIWLAILLLWLLVVVIVLAACRMAAISDGDVAPVAAPEPATVPAAVRSLAA